MDERLSRTDRASRRARRELSRRHACCCDPFRGICMKSSNADVMKRSRTEESPNDEPATGSETTPEREGISPMNPATFPRAEDDEETFANSPDFHDVPDPGPNVGRRNPGHNY